MLPRANRQRGRRRSALLMGGALAGGGATRTSPDLDQPAARRHKPDYWLLAIVAFLLAIGLMVVYAISPALSQSAHVSTNYYVDKQLLAIGLSIVAFVITSRLPLGYWRRWLKPLLFVAAAATLLALVLPVNPNYPAHRWVRLGGLSFQSVELLKFAGLIWLAALLADRLRSGNLNNLRNIVKPLGIALVAIGLVVVGVQSDLGSGGVMLMMFGSMVYVAGFPMKRILLVGSLVALALVMAIMVTPYRRARLEAYFHPSSTNCSQQVTGYQACQALIAVGSGGVIGLGLGSSVQAYGYLPEAANDSIFAIYAEKFGFIGSIILLIIFGALFARLASIAERAPDDFSRLLVVGVLSWFSIQALINIGAMIGLLPLKGITLPLISYGGTSVVFVAAAVGIVFQISHYTSLGAIRVKHDGPGRSINRGGGYDDSSNRRRLGGAYHPDSGRGRTA